MEKPSLISREYIENMHAKDTVNKEVLQKVLDLVPEDLQTIQKTEEPFTEYETDEWVIHRGMVSRYIDHSYSADDPKMQAMKKTSQDALVFNLRESDNTITKAWLGFWMDEK